MLTRLVVAIFLAQVLLVRANPTWGQQSKPTDELEQEILKIDRAEAAAVLAISSLR